jgi:adenylate cyclase
VGGVAEGFCTAAELSDAERDVLLQLYCQRLDAFRMQRGEEVACLLIEKSVASCNAAATCQFFNRSSTARSRLGSD